MDDTVFISASTPVRHGAADAATKRAERNRITLRDNRSIKTLTALMYIKNRRFATILFPLALMLLFSLTTLGQEAGKVPNLPKFDLAKKHFGFYLGVNQMFFVIKPAAGFQDIIWQRSQLGDVVADSARILAIESKPIPGFTIGIVGNLRLGKYFDLRFLPGLQFGERQITYNLEQYRRGDTLYGEVLKNIPTTNIDFPLYLKYKSERVHNFRAFVFAGATLKIDLSSQAKNKDETEEVTVKLEQTDLNFMGGVGIDIYTVYFKMGIELSMAYGMADLLHHDDMIYTKSIDKLSSKIFQLSFTFE